LEFRATELDVGPSVEDSQMSMANLVAALFEAPVTIHLLTLIVVSAVAQCFLGALWYGVIFKKSWKDLTGLGNEQKPKSQISGVVASLLACFLLSFVLAHILGLARSLTAMEGVAVGIVCWFGFMGPPLFMQHILENRRVNLLAINAGYWLLAMAVGGAILSAFR
jgi:hypothetical protein